jgi:hypothetical protein
MPSFQRFLTPPCHCRPCPVNDKGGGGTYPFYPHGAVPRTGALPQPSLTAATLSAARPEPGTSAASRRLLCGRYTRQPKAGKGNKAWVLCDHFYNWYPPPELKQSSGNNSRTATSGEGRGPPPSGLHYNDGEWKGGTLA